jgi:hypothetical protein
VVNPFAADLITAIAESTSTSKNYLPPLSAPQFLYQKDGFPNPLFQSHVTSKFGSSGNEGHDRGAKCNEEHEYSFTFTTNVISQTINAISILRTLLHHSAYDESRLSFVKSLRAARRRTPLFSQLSVG